MQNTTTLNPPNRTVRYIPATINVREMIRSTYRQLRVAAYCRVSTKQDEQINSYENQKKIYTDRLDDNKDNRNHHHDADDDFNPFSITHFHYLQTHRTKRQGG